MSNVMYDLNELYFIMPQCITTLLLPIEYWLVESVMIQNSKLEYCIMYWYDGTFQTGFF